MKSIVRWAGSKRSLLPELRTFWRPSYVRYIEPFAGSASLFFDVHPTKAVLSDLNDDLMNTYRMLRLDVEAVLAGYQSLKRGKRAFYEVRSLDPSKMSKRMAAARFLYLNRYCFNGLYRTNLKGRFNVPYGPPVRPLTMFENNVRRASVILKSATLLSADFDEAIKLVSKGDFVYLDPPYVVDERRIFREYLPGSFHRGDLERLSSALQTIDKRGATFVMSYEDSMAARDLVKQWSWRFVKAQRNIAGFAGHRKQTNELIASNGDL